MCVNFVIAYYVGKRRTRERYCSCETFNVTVFTTHVTEFYGRDVAKGTDKYLFFKFAIINESLCARLDW